VNRSEAMLVLRTVRHLRPVQVAHRLRLVAQRRAIALSPERAERLLTRPHGDVPGWPEGFRPVDAQLGPLWPDTDLLAHDRVVLLGSERGLLDWRPADAPQLWRYHLQYWDWAWSLALAPDRLRGRAVHRRLWRRWQEQSVLGRWDEWSPYVVALRAWSWCGQYDALVRGADHEEPFLSSLALHASYLERHLELDVGGNHLVKDLKSLVSLGVFFGDRDLLDRSLRRLRREVGRQVLPDGGHVERAPAYHCQVLADLVDLDGLLGTDSPAWLGTAVRRMQAWLGLVLLPDGSVPLVNDGFPVSEELLALLRPGPPAPDGLTVLADTGLVVLRRGGAHVLADVGLPCPDDLPAHAHADTLGFLLTVHGRRVVSEAGTSTYRAGADRAYERSTAAHSTVEVDGESSTEVWGAFRAARRARPTLLGATDDGRTIVVCASHDGYRRLPGRPVHRRTWTLDDRRLRVRDELLGGGEHEVVVRLHGAVPGDVEAASGALVPEVATVARGWEVRERAPVLVHRARATLSWCFEVELPTRGET